MISPCSPPPEVTISMSRYQGRHRGRHRAPQTTRLTRSAKAGLAVPTAAAAALAVTASGATVAESDQLTLDLTTAQQTSAQLQAADEVAETADLSQRKAEVVALTTAKQGRAQEQARIAREKARQAAIAKKKAAEAAANRAKLEREGKKWVMPIDGAIKTSGFGPRWGRLHAGNDFGCSIGTPLKSMSKGTVIFAGAQSGYGNKVEIRYWDGTVSYFGHMNSVGVTVGQEVFPGEVVGECGNTGRSTGPHLHLEIHPNGGGPIDPSPWLAKHGLG